MSKKINLSQVAQSIGIEEPKPVDPPIEKDIQQVKDETTQPLMFNPEMSFRPNMDLIDFLKLPQPPMFNTATNNAFKTAESRSIRRQETGRGLRDPDRLKFSIIPIEVDKLKPNTNYPLGYEMPRNRERINAMIEVLKGLYDTYDEINFICMGSSGSIIAGALSMHFENSRIIYLAKSGEISHNDHNGGELRYSKKAINIIVDDHVASGRTFRKIVDICMRVTRETIIFDATITCSDIDLNMFEDIFKGSLKRAICGRAI